MLRAAKPSTGSSRELRLLFLHLSHSLELGVIIFDPPQSVPEQLNKYTVTKMDCCFTSRLREVQAPQKGPEFGTWSQMGPKYQNGPKKVPILPPSPKFLILPSDAAEKRRHIAVSHCCALFRHTQCIMCMYFMLSGPLLPTDH